MDTTIFFWKPNNVKSAISGKMTPISVDYEAKTGVFASSRGNKTYTCTLDQCPCTDFSINRKPCKHMIRLAHELHVITLEGVQDSKAAAQEKQELSIADALMKDVPLQNALVIFITVDALKNGEAISDEQLALLHDYMPFLVTDNGTFNREKLPVYQTMKAKLSNRLGLLLVEHAGELTEDVLNLLCLLDDPSFE
ncbi:MAG: hypothetical protein MR821_00850 [Clostridiales bacterium]|nr:hypothetical protein [Clostridiales bacterium]